MTEQTWSDFKFDMAEVVRSLIATINTILANATPNEIAGLVTWGELTCSGLYIAVYRNAVHFQAEINRSTPATSPERQHGWEKPPNMADEMAQLRLYTKQKLAEAGYDHIEIVTLW